MWSFQREQEHSGVDTTISSSVSSAQDHSTTISKTILYSEHSVQFALCFSVSGLTDL